MVVNFTRHVKTSLISEVHPNEVVTVAVYPRYNVSSKVMSPQRVIICTF
jgi:hypothetical protein